MSKATFLSKVSFRSVRKLLLAVVGISLIFASGYVVGFSGFRADMTSITKVSIIRETPKELNLDFSLFWRVWDILADKYFDKLKLIPQEMIYGAIQGMVASIGDPYTVFLPPSQNKMVQEDLNGEFDGVGIQIGFKGSRLVVIAPLPGSPAEKAGVRAGDYIVGIIDEEEGFDVTTVGITLPEAVRYIRGSKGTKVTLVLLRDGEEDPVEIPIVRETIEVPSVILEYLEDGTIAHVRLLKFGGETDGEWDETVRELLKRGNLKGIILDLRNNPGGFLDEAVNVAGEFLKGSEVVVIEENYTGQKHEFRSEGLGRLLNTPLIIVVNKGSASASEILAGSLRDIAGITIIGETTFGKGTIQEPIQLETGSALHITIARWLTPKGIWVNDVGLKPDVEVEDDLLTEQDEQLQKALELFKAK